MSLARFFLKVFLFFLAGTLAIGLTYSASIKWQLVPPPPADWAKAINNMRDTSENLQKATADLRKTAETMTEPVKQSIELAKKIVDKWPALPDVHAPGGGQQPPSQVQQGLQHMSQPIQQGLQRMQQQIPQGTQQILNPLQH